MAHYKNLDLEAGLAGLIKHMESVEEYRESLQTLQAVWDNLSLLGQLSGTAADMGGTRKAFEELSAGLLSHLAAELRKKAIDETRSKAQAVIDMLVRNLFERTADIGFLATDDDIRRYLCADAAGQAAQEGQLLSRFEEYRSKYSVYSDIILFAPDGRILTRLDRQAPLQTSGAGLALQALHSTAPYTESFGRFDFLPQADAALLYSCRVTGAGGAPLGVLALCFRFEDEMQRIFASLQSDDDHSVALLIDGEGRVLASSDGFHVPPGAKLPRLLASDGKLLELGGNDYLLACRPATPFQGYAGPGWRGAVLLPVRYAFNQDGSRMLEEVDPEMLDDVLASTSMFSDALRRIPQQAESIQRELNRSVWNGSVTRTGTDPAFSKVLLGEISKTGMRTRDVFSRSIANLHETVVSSVLRDSRFLAAQAADIMDRNLYERANDCRWWALFSQFRQALAGADADTGNIAAVLRYINSLYTVYTTLLVFDAQGKVCAVSDPGSEGLAGAVLEEEWVGRTLRLQDPNQFAVSDFAPTQLYGGRPTYVFSAAVFAPGQRNVVGGIGVVFDAAAQLRGMLNDVLPRGSARDAFAAFVDERGRVVACSDDRLRPGQELPAAAGGDGARIVCFDGMFYAAGIRRTQGYREYGGAASGLPTVADACVFLPLCDEASVHRRRSHAPLSVVAGRDDDASAMEAGTFRIGEDWYGLPTGEVVAAVAADKIVRVPGHLQAFAGYQMFDDKPVPVFDLGYRQEGEGDGAPAEVIIVRGPGGQNFGLVVDELGGVADIPGNRRKNLPAAVQWGRNVMTDFVVSADPPRDARMLQVLSSARIADWLKAACPEQEGGEAAMVPLEG